VDARDSECFAGGAPFAEKLLELEYLEDFEHFQQRVRG
jgi:hypothetical protein